MQYLELAVTIAGFLIIFLYQRQKIGALERQISSQKDILGNAKTFIDLFDPERLKGYGEAIERKVRAEVETEMTQLKSQYTEKDKNCRDIVSNIVKDYISVTRAFVISLVYVPWDRRKEVFNKLDDGTIKQALGNVVETINKEELAARETAWRNWLAENPPEK